MNAATRRGQPAIALVLVLGIWVTARAALLAWPAAVELPGTEPALAQAVASAPVEPAVPDALPPQLAAVPFASTPPQPIVQRPMPPISTALPAIAMPAISAPAASSAPQTASPAVRLIAGQQLLYLAAFAYLPLPPEVLAARPELARASVAAPVQSRWSGDGWLLWRQDGGSAGAGRFLTPSYGTSQAGAVLRYRLAPASSYSPLLYLRGSSALGNVPERELALGFAARPIPRLPIAAMVEARATRSGGHTRLRPAVALVSELPPLRLPGGLRGEAYVQGGYVGGPDASLFVDGQARIDRRLVRIGPTELRGGGAVWGGAQRGAARLDLGPSATLQFRVGEAQARLSADWRFRVAGQAAPGSGPALTLSAGF